MEAIECPHEQLHLDVGADVSDTDDVLNLYLTLAHGDHVPAQVIATVASSLPAIMSEFAGEYADLGHVEWEFVSLGIGSFQGGMAASSAVDEATRPQLRIVNQRFAEAAAEIERGSDPSDVLPGRSSEPFGRITRLFNRGVTSIQIGAGAIVTTLTPEGAGKHEAHRVRQRSLGSVTGVVQGVSFVGSHPYFSLRRRSSTRVVKCFFDEESMDQNVIAALRRNVTVHGLLVRDDDGVLQRIEVTQPLDVRSSSEPSVTIQELIGIAPDLTDGLSSDEWIRRQRGDR